MTCGRIDNDLDPYLDGDLDENARRALDAHVAECAACRGKLARAQALRAALASLPVPPAAPGFYESALQSAARPAPRRASRIVAAGFLGAFGLTVLTVLLTGLWVRAPRSHTAAAPESSLDVQLELHEQRTVNLLFASRTALDDVTLLVALPPGVELRGHEGQSQVVWRTRLQAGNNLLPLELVATMPRGGSLGARLTHDGKETTFVVNVSVGSG